MDRRQFLSYIPAATVAAVSVVGRSAPSASAQDAPSVGAIETLMRGHGLLLRAIIIYDVVRERLAKQQEIEPSLIQKTTAVIHNYLQGYHENMEERFIFKPMEKAQVQFSSIQDLKIQHGTGHELIRRITNLTKTGKPNAELAGYMESFGRMYKYHAAWEDTVVFPAFDELEKRRELTELAATFELEEKSILGQTGFASFLNDIASVEKQLGINGLSAWTAKL